MTLQKIYLMTGFLIVSNFMHTSCSQNLSQEEVQEINALTIKVHEQFTTVFNQSNRLQALIEERSEKDIAVENADNKKKCEKMLSKWSKENTNNPYLYFGKISKFSFGLCNDNETFAMILSLVEGNSFEYNELEKLRPILVNFAGFKQEQVNTFLHKIKTRWKELEFGVLPEHVQPFVMPVSNTSGVSAQLNNQAMCPRPSSMQIPMSKPSEDSELDTNSSIALQETSIQPSRFVSKYPAPKILSESEFHGMQLAIQIQALKKVVPEKEFTAEELVNNSHIKKNIALYSKKLERKQNIIDSAKKFGVWNQEQQTVGNESLSHILAHKIDLSKDFNSRLFGKQLTSELQKNNSDKISDKVKNLIAVRRHQRLQGNNLE